MMTEFGLFRKSSKLPATICCGKIGGLEMESGLDAEKVNCGVLESGPRAERSAQDRRAGGDIGKLPADSHDFPRICDSVEHNGGVAWIPLTELFGGTIKPVARDSKA